MKKKLLLIFLLSFGISQARAQGSITDRKDLHDLLDVRRQKFEAYSGSLGKKSGFFGNKTKKDVQHSNDVLNEIVETDNHIISLLNRVVDVKNFEKVNRNYDLYASQEQLTNLERATDTLTKQLDEMAISDAKLKSKITGLQWMVWLLSVSLIAVLIGVIRNKYFIHE